MHVVVSREDYFAAASTILAEQGVGKLRIANLCRALKVTSGSFYGYFGNLAGFTAEFLAHWETTATEQLVAQAEAEPDPVLRIHLLRVAAGQRLQLNTEASIRGWAHINDTVKETVERVDRRREQALADTLAPVVGDERARRLAFLGMTMLVGLQQLRQPVSAADYDTMLSEFENLVFAGQPAAVLFDDAAVAGPANSTALAAATTSSDSRSSEPIR